MGVDLPISGLPVAIPLDDADLTALVQAGVTNRATLDQVRDFVLSLIEVIPAVTDVAVDQQSLDSVNAFVTPLAGIIGWQPLSGSFISLVLSRAAKCVVNVDVIYAFTSDGSVPIGCATALVVDGIPQRGGEIVYNAGIAVTEATLTQSWTWLVPLPTGTHTFSLAAEVNYLGGPPPLIESITTSMVLHTDAGLVLTTRRVLHPLFTLSLEDGDLLGVEDGDILITE
jgi:hypothetical protein